MDVLCTAFLLAVTICQILHFLKLNTFILIPKQLLFKRCNTGNK